MTVQGVAHPRRRHALNGYSFLTEGTHRIDAYQLTPLGLLAPPELVWKGVS